MTIFRFVPGLLEWLCSFESGLLGWLSGRSERFENVVQAHDNLNADHGHGEADTVKGSGDRLPSGSSSSGSSSASELGPAVDRLDHQLRPQPRIEYDIFINHRGPDTKENFVTFLEDALKEKRYTPFFDKKMEKGTHAFKEIKEAIQNTQVHLAIFSPRYAESKYCLDELVDMLECREKYPNSVTLIPIFYNVKPLDLRMPDSDGTPFQEAFQKHVEKVKMGRRSHDQISRWKKALQDAADYTGYEFVQPPGDANELKNKIVHLVQERISPRRGLGREQPLLEPSVGFQAQRARILKKLEEDGDNVAILGICGMGGIGKTTLAQEIYNHYSKNRAFEYYTFLKLDHDLKDVGELQRQALRDLLNKEEKNVVERYLNHYGELAGVKVLVVVDNISCADHFKQLVPMKELGPGSRIILTSRERHTVNAVMEDAPTKFASHVHEMKELNEMDSFELFWFHAFRNKELPREKDVVFRPIALQVVALCRGLPLALKVIGQHLLGKSKEVWEDATISIGDRSDISDVLSISYKGLDSPSDKMMFLDVACQMIGMLEEDAVDIWKSCAPCSSRYCVSSKKVHDSLQTLKDKSLVEVGNDNRLTMHDLLREMGRNMVIGIKPYLLPCHLWNPKQAKEILDDLDEESKEGSKEIRGISLAGLQHGEAIDASTLRRMTEIHLMQLDGARIEGDFSRVSGKIRWLHWTSSFLTNLPPQLRLQYLTILDLSNSSSLTRLWSDTDTQAVPRLLRVLHLQNCISLEEVPETIRLLTKLRTLNLQGCKRLKLLPGCLGELQSLQDLNLSECENLESLPDGMVNLSNLKTFSMNTCSMITDLPADFGNLGALIKFSAHGASRLTCLPESFSRLSDLEELWLWDCPALSELPKSVKGLVKLRLIHLNVTGVKQLPDDFGELGSLVELHITENSLLQSLPESFGKLGLLQILDLTNCRKLKTLPRNFGDLQSLTDLNLQACAIEDGDLPVSFGGLKRLSNFRMPRSKLTTLPESFRELTALALLNMRESPDLLDVETLPAFIEELELGNCPKLSRVDLVAKVTKLRKLILANCTGLTDVQGLESMEGLQEINVSGCSSLSKTDKALIILPSTVANECHLSGSGVCLKYNNNWAQDGAPNLHLVSYYDHDIGFIENAMTRKISSLEHGNAVCVETSISMKDDQTQIEAVVITVVAHDQGWSDSYWEHGKYNGNCYFEARILRAEGEAPVFTSSLFSLRHADYWDQVYICTLRKSHPLVEKLQDGDRICVIARSIYQKWEITVMQGSTYIAYSKPDLGIWSSDVIFGDLDLKDYMSSKFRRPGRLPLVHQAFTSPARLQFSCASSYTGGHPEPYTQLVRLVYQPNSVQNDPKSLVSHAVCSPYCSRICDNCQKVICSQRGWHCNTCDAFDLCETCYVNPENAPTQIEPAIGHHPPDHSMSVFEAPPNERSKLILMQYIDGVAQQNWGYVVYDYPNARWFETFNLIPSGLNASTSE